MAMPSFHPTWIQASAGSGKTKALVDRILSILLEAIEPHRILCLTFTNHASQEMLTRIHSQLSSWQRCDIATLSQDLERLGKKDPIYLTRARGLWGDVLNSSLGLRIQTIHGLCQSILKKFPIETGVSPGFHILEPQEAKAFKERSQRLLFQEIMKGGDLKEEAWRLWQDIPMGRFWEYLDHLLENRWHFLDFCNQPGALEKEKEKWNRPAPWGEIYQVLVQCREGGIGDLFQGALLGEKDKTILEKLVSVWQDPCPTQLNYLRLESIFLTQAGGLRKQVLSAKLRSQLPEAYQVIQRLQQAFWDYHQAEAHRQHMDKSLSLFEVFRRFFHHYQELKKKACVLDYDDLIEKTALLFQENRFDKHLPWILYKLDHHIHHILVDEAQDTSEKQWSVITTLMESMMLSDPLEKSFFIVGDPKQSIYRFQGASPDSFQKVQEKLRTLVERSGSRLEVASLNRSYRSLPKILEVVDHVFGFLNVALNQDAFQGVLHEPCEEKKLGKGKVEVWFPAASQEESPGYQVLAKEWVGRIKGWLSDRPLHLDQEQRTVRPHDIMVLVTKRDQFLKELLYQAKVQGVPMSAPDPEFRDWFFEDLRILGRWVVTPYDDLFLGTLLRSSFFGWGEEEVFYLSQNRRRSLWRALMARAAQPGQRQETYGKACKWLDFFSKLYRDNPDPLSFYYKVFQVWGVGAWSAWFGQDMQPRLLQFLDIIEAYRQKIGAAGSLGHFLLEDWQGAMDSPRGEGVQIRTVHGSKGLQAPVVILADGCRTLQGHEPFLKNENSQGGLPGMLWPSQNSHPLAKTWAQAKKDNDLKEHARLLYVGMTRAQEHLYVTGWLRPKDKEIPKDSWMGWFEQCFKKGGFSSQAKVTKEVALAKEWHTPEGGVGPEKFVLSL